MRLGKVWMLTAVFALAAARPMAVNGAVMVYEGDYYGYEEDDEEEDEGYRRRDSDGSQYAGPGIVTSKDSDVKSQGPAVKTVSLSENYHEEYGVYEESLNDQYFLYSNVSNGGITDRPVTVDIPANVAYIMEMDGREIPYTSGQPVGGRGTYVLRLSVVANPTAPLSKQEEYHATFRFRIQEKLPDSEREDDGQTSSTGTLTVNGSDGIGWSHGGSAGSAGDRNTGREDAGAGERGNGGAAGEDRAGGEDSQASEGQENQEDGEKTDETSPEGENGTAEESGETGEGQEAGGTDGTEADGGSTETDGQAGDIETGAETAGNNGLQRSGIKEQIYVPEQESYLVTMENGRDFLSSVPAGYVGPGPVRIVVAEGETCELYWNDSPTEYIRGNSQVEAGTYRLSLDGQEFAFTIAQAVNKMELYPAPLGMVFEQVYLDEEPVKLASDQYLSMGQDGAYEIILAGEAGQRMEFVLHKDTKGPEAAVSVSGGTASIQYLSDDISKIILEKDGVQVEGFSGYQVDTPGSYRLIVEDAAGNQGVAWFTLRYQVNRYGILAVVLVILVIAGAAVFTLHVKRTIKIR